MARPEELYFGWMHGRRFLLKKDYSAIDPRWKGYDKGKTVKAVMVSRMGDVGVTLKLDAEYGYDLRVMPHELEPTEPVPENVCKLCHLEFTSGDHGKCSLDRKCERCGGETGPGDPKCPKCCFAEWKEQSP